MSAPLNYTSEIPTVMAEVGRRTAAIDTLVADLERLITPFVAESAGQAFATLQQAIATWKSGAGEHTAVQAAFRREGDDSYVAMMGADRQASGYFQT